MTVTINGAAPTTAQQRDFAAAMGLPVLLQTVTVASAQQDIDFTGLNLDVDASYQIDLSVVQNSAGVGDIFCYYNADLTAANYQNQTLVADSTSVASARASTARFAGGFTTSDTTDTLLVTGRITKYTGKKPSAATKSTSSTASGIVMVDVAHRWSGTSNVTSIKLRHTSNFGVGTVAKIYKV